MAKFYVVHYSPADEKGHTFKAFDGNPLNAKAFADTALSNWAETAAIYSIEADNATAAKAALEMGEGSLYWSGIPKATPQQIAAAEKAKADRELMEDFGIPFDPITGKAL